MKNYFDRFDGVFCLKYAGAMEKARRLDRELQAVGVTRHFDILNSKTPLNSFALRNRPKRENAIGDGTLDSTLGHMRMICSAYQMGCESALFCEDDIGFLRGGEEDYLPVNTLPDGFGVALFDYAPWDCLVIEGKDEKLALEAVKLWKSELSKVNEDWFVAKKARLLSCYALDRRGMEAFIHCYDQAFNGRLTFRLCDHWLHRSFLGLDIHICSKPLAVQMPLTQSNTNQILFRRVYDGLGVDISKYGHK